MSEPLTIYECPSCGRVSPSDEPFERNGWCAANDHPDVVAVRVWREEDVRPLWEAVEEADPIHRAIDDLDVTSRYVLDESEWDPIAKAHAGFPAPEEWKR